MTHSHCLTLGRLLVDPCQGEAADPVGQALRRASWLRDLESLERIERQRECFFDAMGALHAALEGRAG